MKFAGLGAVFTELPGCVVASTVGEYGPDAQVNAGSGVEGEMTNGPLGMLNRMSGEGVVAHPAFAFVIASRREPAPPSSVLMTTSEAAPSSLRWTEACC